MFDIPRIHHPQLPQLLAPLFDSRIRASVLEIGPGSKTVLEYLLDRLERKVGNYTSLQPNEMAVAKLEEWLVDSSTFGEEERESPPLPYLKIPPVIHWMPFSAK